MPTEQRYEPLDPGTIAIVVCPYCDRDPYPSLEAWVSHVVARHLEEATGFNTALPPSIYVPV